MRRAAAAVCALALLLGTARAEPAIGFAFAETNLLNRFAPAQTLLNLDGEAGFRSEFSGACFHPLTGELLVVMRGAGTLYNQHGIQYYTPDGAYLRHVRLTGFDDLEGICIVDPASNTVAVVEEGLNAITILAVETNTVTLDKSEGRTLQMGLGYLGNRGIEGIVWDASRSCFYAVKEWLPIAIYRVTDLGGTNALTEVLFDAPAKLGALCTDLSDIEYDPVTDRLLILSDESQVVVETDLEGNVLGTLPVALIQPEGIGLPPSRRELYVIGEPNHYQRWESVPTHTVTRGNSLSIPLTIDATPDPEAPVSVDVVAVSSNAVFGVDVLVASNVVITAADTGSLWITAMETLDLNPPAEVWLTLTNPVNATLGPEVTEVCRVVDPGGFTGAVTTAGIGVPFRAVVSAIATNGTLLTDFTGGATLHLEKRGEVPYPLFDPVYSNSFSPAPRGQIYFGLRFTPLVPLVATHARYRWGETVSLWTDEGEVLAQASGPFQPQVWQIAAFENPVTLVTGRTYRVAALQNDRNGYYELGTRTLPAVLSTVVIESGCRGSPAGEFPATLESREYIVDLLYLKSTVVTTAVSPTTIAPFVGGEWAGWLTATEAVDQAHLVIRNAYDQSGESGVFAVADYPPVVLTLPFSVMENAGVLEDVGSVGLGTNGWDQPREVRLYAEPAGQVLVPAVVEVPAFAESATFDLDVVDDDVPEGTRTVTLYATAPGYATGIATLLVVDDDHPPGLLLRIVQRVP